SFYYNINLTGFGFEFVEWLFCMFIFFGNWGEKFDASGLNADIVCECQFAGIFVRIDFINRFSTLIVNFERNWLVAAKWKSIGKPNRSHSIFRFLRFLNSLKAQRILSIQIDDGCDDLGRFKINGRIDGWAARTICRWNEHNVPLAFFDSFD